MNETRQVQVPHSYFQKAKSEYSDWRWAMIREFIQNAYDAQATTIDFRLTINAAGRIELHVDDDGIGMDRDTLENVLLCICLLYTSPSPRDRTRSRMPSSA